MNHQGFIVSSSKNDGGGGGLSANWLRDAVNNLPLPFATTDVCGLRRPPPRRIEGCESLFCF